MINLIFTTIFLVLSIFLFKVYKSLNKTKTDWKISNLSNKGFISKYKNLLKQIFIGCSFAPEMWSRDEIERGDALNGLKFIVEKIGIKDIRLGIRWSEAINQDGKITLDFYKPFLEYCFKNKVEVCLSLGPIKTFRWPEEHIPQQILDKLNNPIKKYKKIKSRDEVAIEAYNYLDKLIEKLRSEFTRDELQSIKIIQLENEGFNRMGTFKLKMSKSYFENIILKANKFFPNSKILVNSPGRFNLMEIIKLFKILDKKYPRLRNKLLIGYDYYYRTEYRDRFILTKLLDSISYSLPWDTTVKKLRKISTNHNFQTEVTEAQFEPWGTYLGAGNSVRDFKYMLIRSSKILNLEKNDKNVIRLWGIENFVKKFLSKNQTTEHFEILELIKKVNK